MFGVVPALSLATLRGEAQRPTFRTAAEVISVDVQIVDRHGEPMIDLPASAFDVRIDGRRRTVTAVGFVRLDDAPAPAATDVVAVLRSGWSGEPRGGGSTGAVPCAFCRATRCMTKCRT